MVLQNPPQRCDNTAKIVDSEKCINKNSIPGQVPALFDNGKIVIESLDIADYLEEKYNTQTPLYPKDPAAKKRDQEVIRNLLPGPTGLLSKVQYSSETYSAAAALDLLLPAAQPLEDELAKRETRFFGGEKPGMVSCRL